MQIILKTDVVIEGTVKEGAYNEVILPSYFSGAVTDVLDEEYKTLYDREIPDGRWGGEIDINDAFCQFSYARGIVARLLYRVLKYRMDKAIEKGIPDLDVLFIYNMPIRGASRMTGGAVNMKMVYGITEIANGHFFRGLGMIISGFISYKISYYLTEDIEGSCFLSGTVSVITFIMSIDFLLNL